MWDATEAQKEHEVNKKELDKLFNCRNGKLYNKIHRNPKALMGAEAGSYDSYGYRQLKINRKTYKVHRLIYMMHYGEFDQSFSIDHINGIKDDNRIENLRLVTHQENHFNRTAAKGCYWNKINKKWIAQIAVSGNVTYLGSFCREDDAKKAYLMAKDEIHIVTDKTRK